MKPKVSIVGCGDYERAKVEAAVRKSVDLVGGIESFVQKGQSVLIKPNLLSASEPEKNITTHPEVVRALALLVGEVGGKPVIGDSPGGLFTQAALRRVYKKTGLTAVAEETGAELNFDVGVSIKPNPDGKLLKAVDVCDFVSKADVVITAPKFKTHTFMQFTGATKILFGAVPGLTKAGYHAKLKDPQRFAQMLIDALRLVNPRLSVMDAVVGMEGEGPAAGDARKIGAILAGSDSVALDVVSLAIAGMPAESVPPLKAAIERGLTSGRVEDVEVLGDGLEGFIQDGFKRPSTAVSRTLFLMGLLRPVLTNQLTSYPVATDECVRCGVCARHCPVEAITMADKAVMDYGKCIRCYCCHELCPHHAIILNKPILRKLLK